MSGPRQFFQCGPEMPEVWTPLDMVMYSSVVFSVDRRESHVIAAVLPHVKFSLNWLFPLRLDCRSAVSGKSVAL